ncbi:hypothetical protein [Streptobacillus moniliformis]|uniref:hypothetical protein n=1 Tax=Streptobacillus moniliformis TaxID=34105 RepID=UPI0007E4A8E7|nr:hypothetical protein [Streptobacillus moniliformis]
MRKLNEYNGFDEFLDDFKNFNEKSKYFKIDMNANILIKEPSYILEYGYMYYVKGFKDVNNVFDLKDIYLRKEKKIKRHSSIEKEKLKESFFRAIFNRDEIHSLSLSNELIRRDSKMFFDILYLNAKLSDDANRLIKIYLFEKIFEDIGLSIPFLRNLIGYICKSKEGYGNKKEVDKLYSYILKNRFNEEIEVNVNKMNENNTIILRFLEEEQC